MGKKPKNQTTTKVRFDGVDVAAMVSHLTRTLLGRRIINIYDAVTESGNDGYLLKLDGNAAEKNAGGKGDTTSEASAGRTMLFLESGIRFHTTTQQIQQEGKMPTPFCMKLRKHLRGLRFERIQQLGNLDRVVDFIFGSGSNRHSLVLELYARGNILLCNASYEIQALLRSHEYGTNNQKQQQDDKQPQDSSSSSSVQVKVGNVYPVTYATSLQITPQQHDKEEMEDSTKSVDDTTTANNDESTTASGILNMSGSEAKEWARQQLLPVHTPATTSKGGNKKKPKNDNHSGLPLKALLLKPASGVYHYGPSLIEHCILCAKLDPTFKFSTSGGNDDNDKSGHYLEDSDWTSLIQSLQNEGSKILKQLATEETGGYILYRPKDATTMTTTTTPQEAQEEKKSTSTIAMTHSDKILEQFQPHLLQQHQDKLYIKYETFAGAVDDFFFHIGGQKRAIRAEAAEAAALEKLQKVKRDQERRVKSLLREQDKLKQDAQLVETHAEDVDKALSVINSALDSGMDWDALDQLVEVEQENGNPIALLIKRLDLENDAMVLALPDSINPSTTMDDDDDDDDDDNNNSEDDDGDNEINARKMNVTISLQESAYGNARDMFAKYRAYKEKMQKTLEASVDALKAAEATAQRQLLEAQKRTKATATIQHRRKAHWWEKFHWFITSDNYLVLGGRDAQQNEMLVKRYLRPGDAYLHADVHGAASCILRAKKCRRRSGDKKTTQVLPLSDQALREAGNFTICLSSAWTSRMVTSAWWVEPHQVSKTAPTGEYLTVGSFMVRGKKNFLPPSQLEMGLAVLFRLGDEDSMARHKNERRDFALMDDNEDDDDYVDELDNALEDDMADMSIRNVPAEEPEATKDAEDEDNSNIIQAQKEEEEVEVEKEEPTPDGAESTPEENGDKGEEYINKKDQPEQDAEVEKDQQTLSEGEVNSRAEVSEPLKKSPSVEAPIKKKKGLSARDRKLIKKYGSLEAAEEAAKLREKEEAERVAKQPKKKTDASNSNAKERKVEAKRGKKSKMKRAARKYDDQDDEDRELALMALHGGEKKGKKKGKQKNSVTSDTQKKASAEAAALLLKDPSKVVEKLPEAVQKALAACVSIKAADSTEETIRWDKFDADVLDQVVALETEPRQLAAANRLLTLKQSSRIDNFSASLAGIVRTIQRYGHEHLEIDTTGEGAKRKTKAEKEKEKEAWKEALAEEGIAGGDEDGEDAVDDTAELMKLTGKPHPDDILQYAVPVCAPYYTLSQYKYKVKLTPGNQKRGKAAKQCVDMFVKSDGDKSSSRNRERELIKHVVDNDWVQAICANVKISAAGASKAAKKHKASHKKKASKKKK